ncbi:MAG: DUF1579 family protein [Ignavibacteriaceae bacterium]|nr:DUF1579 family protein [Ignavibacteriaceae bacterium]
MWMYPGAEPTYSEGTATAEMILGGRYLKMVNKGMVMGMPMEGWSLECYDNGKMEFTNIWIDNMGTGMAISKGKWNEADNTITYEGTMYDPIEKKEMPFTSLAKKLDDNNSLFEMYMEYQGQKFKSLEIKYSR